MSIIALWVLVLFETTLLLLLLRVLGDLRQRGSISSKEGTYALEEWGLPIGEKAPSFVVKDETGKTIRFEDFRGKRRIITFISPECHACSTTIEALNEFQRGKRAIALLVIGELDRESNLAYARKNNAQMPILTPQRDLAMEVYRCRAIPFTFILDEDGIIRAKDLTTDGEALEMLLEAAFGHSLDAISL
ncbi:MAG: TlpA disulfide reductase family protein [Ktedonobacteraceae bacterium]